MSGAIPRELRKLAQQAVKQGWRVEKTSGGHLRWLPPGGRRIVVTPSTGKMSGHGAANVIADLRRSGLRV